MKRLVKVLAIVVLAAVVGFSLASCVINLGDDGPNHSLNGTWKGRDNAIVKINGDSGIFIQVSTTTYWSGAKSRGNISDGDLWMRGLDKAGNLKWTCEERLVRTNYTVYWDDCTITLAEDGKTFQTRISATNYNTWTRQ
jgi:hypothetical protein